MKVVINKRYGGFSLSDQAIETLADLKGIELYKGGKEYYTDPKLENYYSPENYPRYDEDLVTVIETLADLKGIELYKGGKEYYTDPKLENYYSPENYPRYDEDLVTVIETLGKAANTRFSDLVVVEIPDGVNYYIDEYDGMEIIRETHRTWG